MKIDLVATSGSPIGVIPPDLHTRGLGGAENALVSLMAALAKRGHDVTVYNNPKAVGDFDNVKYRNLVDLKPEQSRDALILFRVPYPYVTQAKSKKIFWSCDQYTAGNYTTDIFPFVDNIVCISPYHVEYFKQNYQFEHKKITYVDLGVRLEDYDIEVEKVPHQAIYCSVPDRGLNLLRPLWDGIIKRVPDATLKITSDYTVWGGTEAMNASHRVQWLGAKNVQFLGNIPRSELVKAQKQSAVLLYPCIYNELFCVSLAECQVAGAYPVIHPMGALPTTLMYGKSVSGDPQTRGFQDEFVDHAVAAMTNPVTVDVEACRQRFDWNLIAQQWEGNIL